MIEETSLDIFANKLAQLRELFPEVFTEGKIDFKRLRAVLGDEVSFNKEHYELSWAGKSDARAQIQKATSATLIPLESKLTSLDSVQSGNLFIEGENLEVLHILQRSYFGKIKMIYIDPPYNTGNDSFVYPDDYSERQDDYKKRAGITDENGFLNKQDCWKKNSKESGQFHSVWLSMMYPRLYLARNLLREDGVIFISIDDNEQANLKLLCDEIFGAENFIESIVWNKRIPKNDKGIGNIHEYTVVYAKNNETKPIFKLPKDGLDEVYSFVKSLKKKGFAVTEAEKELKRLYNKKGYDRGITLYCELDKNFEIWGKINVSWPNGTTIGQKYDVLHPITKKPVKVPNRGWRWTKETFDGYLDNKNIQILDDGSVISGSIWFAKDENTQPSFIKYLKDVSDLLLKSIISLKSSGGIEAEELLGKNVFPYPKPVSLIQNFISSITANNDIVLDFFAGSGTTAHAVLDLNEQDGGNRQFICVQLPELLDENSEAYKAGYKTIADICKARISKVIEKIQAQRDNNKQTDLIAETPKQILGFNSFKLAPSNFKQWRGDITPDELLSQLELFKDSEKEGSENDSMLIELLLKAGFPLTAHIEINVVSGQELYNVESGKVLFFFDAYNDAVKEFIFKLKPKSVVCLNRVFKGNDPALTNFQLALKDAGIELQII
ncbi:MAG: site-specific DNA-methyltransferase [Methylococcaceae bacterium]